jgi:hypothetical protein
MLRRISRWCYIARARGASRASRRELREQGIDDLLRIALTFLVFMEQQRRVGNRVNR